MILGIGFLRKVEIRVFWRKIDEILKLENIRL